MTQPVGRRYSPLVTSRPAEGSSVQRPGGDPAPAQGSSVTSSRFEANSPAAPVGSAGHRELVVSARQRPSRVEGDWLLGASSAVDEARDIVGRLLSGLAEQAMVGPPEGKLVQKPRIGECSLIGVENDFFDPAASFADNVERLKARGVPRFEHLTAAERAVESRFAEYVESQPEHAVAGAQILAGGDGGRPPIYEVDAMKRLAEGYGTASRPANDEERRFRLRYNHALHPSAVVVARLAFLQKLDELAALPEGDVRRQVFVTNGGCAAGKGSLTGIVKRQLGDIPFGAVWDAAGEGDGLENAWILKACQARNLKVVFGYVENDATQTYNAVLGRAGVASRVVDVATFANSYVEGSRSMKRFLDSPEYRQAVEAGMATAVGIYTGRFDPSSATDPSRPSYPDLRVLNDGGPLRGADLGDAAEHDEVLLACLRVLEAHVAAARRDGRDVEDLLHGALASVAKFLRNESAAERRRHLGMLANIFPTERAAGDVGGAS